MRKLLLIPALLSIASAAQAAPFAVPAGQTRQLPFSGNVANVVIGLDEIAKPSIVDSRIVMITGKKPGLTNVVLFDQAGHTLYSGEILVSAPQGSAMTVIGGPTVTEMLCTPTCQSTTPGAAPAPAMPTAQGGAPGSGTAPATGAAPQPAAAPANPSTTTRAASLTR